MKKIAVDTNILLRLLIEPETEQSRIALRLLETHELFVLKTVFLETEWVLRSIVKADRVTVNSLFRAVIGTDRIIVEDSDAMMLALQLHHSGMDFADAVHVSCLEAGDRFVTFDRDLVRRAAKHIESVSVELAQ